MFKLPTLQGVKSRDGHDNFFTPLRLLFASLVVIGHAFAIVMGGSEAEPQVLYTYTFSYLAVNMFFIASGYLVTKSMLYRGDAASFLSARGLRIYPALITHVAFVMIIIGPLATALPLKEFFSSPDWYLQPLKVLTFVETEMIMPGTFSNNAEQLASGPLWTLRYEVLAYIGTLIVFLLGMMRKKWMVLCQFFVPAFAYMIFTMMGWIDSLPATAVSMLRFGIAYGLGATLYAYRERMTYHWIGLPVLLLLTWVVHQTAALEVVMNLLLAYFVMLLAYVKAPKFEWMQKLPDISYGIYIYHWSVMQMLFHWMPNLSVVQIFALGFPITVALSWMSWTFVEKPMLSKKSWLAGKLRSKKEKPVYRADQMLLD